MSGHVSPLQFNLVPAGGGVWLLSGASQGSCVQRTRSGRRVGGGEFLAGHL